MLLERSAVTEGNNKIRKAGTGSRTSDLRKTCTYGWIGIKLIILNFALNAIVGNNKRTHCFVMLVKKITWLQPFLSSLYSMAPYRMSSTFIITENYVPYFLFFPTYLQIRLQKTALGNETC